MKKIINPCRVFAYKSRRSQVFCKIVFEDGKLSICGVVGPTIHGNSAGGFGQINMDFNKYYPHPDFNAGWNRTKFDKFLDIWHKWHLNDMRPGCEHQRNDPAWDANKVISPGNTLTGKTAGWTYPIDHPEGILTKPCDICGYKYGTKWFKEEVPQDVIDFLFSLPDSTIEPAWV